MAWLGYYEYDGNEIINVTRTETYMQAAGFGWFRPVFENDALPFMLGHGLRYTQPMFDPAPWIDPDVPESHDFYGLYPLDITGIENSTRSSTVEQNIGDGGLGGRIRHGTKEVVFSGLLLAGTDAAADYGMRWLKKALLGNNCPPSLVAKRHVCGGAELTYLSASPDMLIPDDTPVHIPAVIDGGYFVQDAVVQVDDPDLDGGPVLSLSDMQFEGGTPLRTGGFVETGAEYPFSLTASAQAAVIDLGDGKECLTPYLRSLHKVSFNSGPSITSKRETTDGASVWTVEFTGVAGSPYEYGAETPIMDGFLDPTVAIPWAGGVEPEGSSMDAYGYIQPEVACTIADYQPIYDPNCPAVIPPPTAPSVPLGCYTPPKNWRRRQFNIPKQFVPRWGEVVPKVTVYAGNAPIRNLRVRFYPAPPQGEIVEPCAYSGEVLVSYVPAEHTLILDGVNQTVYVVSPSGARQRADSLVFKTDGTPFDWPNLTCGEAYVVTVDLPQTQTPPVLDLSLYPRAV